MQDHTPQLSLFAILRDDLPPIVPITNKQIKDLTGQRFGRLTVFGFVGTRKEKSFWLCHCTCGRHHVTVAGSLSSGRTQSCGCLADEVRQQATLSHGMADTPEWNTWQRMIFRCTNPSATGYEYWGGRGIMVCDGWRHSFDNFYADMGNKPGQGHEFSIDRIDTNGHYSCGHCEHCHREGWVANCRWATLEEQRNNTRRNRYLEFQGERLTIKQWAQKLNIHHDCLYYRYRAGWSTERILTTPAKSRSR